MSSESSENTYGARPNWKYIRRDHSRGFSPNTNRGTTSGRAGLPIGPKNPESYPFSASISIKVDIHVSWVFGTLSLSILWSTSRPATWVEAVSVSMVSLPPGLGKTNLDTSQTAAF